LAVARSYISSPRYSALMKPGIVPSGCKRKWDSFEPLEVVVGVKAHHDASAVLAAPGAVVTAVIRSGMARSVIAAAAVARHGQITRRCGGWPRWRWWRQSPGAWRGWKWTDRWQSRLVKALT
jgi:hypothetical protein